MNEQLPENGGHIHLIAICGVGMAALAGLLQSQGYRVTGSDEGIYPPMSTYLEELGIPVHLGYDPAQLKDSPGLVVVGNAVSRDNPEVQSMLQRETPSISFPHALRRFLIGAKRSLVVAGTHGKTSTTSMMAWVLSQAGLAPSYFIGGMPKNFKSGLQTGNGLWAVLEGDEYDSAFFDKGPKFLHYGAEKVILTSLEFDHADIYSDMAQLKSAFVRLMQSLPATGSVLVCNRYEAAKEVARAAPCPVTYYGEGEPVGWVAKDVRMDQGRMQFEVFYKNRLEGSLVLSLLGRHNVENALGVFAMARELGVSRSVIQNAMGSFAGVRRRQEIKGEIGGITVIDDFAHHPTAIRETITGLRMAYPGQRLWAVFEPRSQTSRRRIFEQEFSHCLAEADRIVVAGLYHPEKIPETERLSPSNVVSRIEKIAGDKRAVYIEKADDIAAYVTGRAKSGDVILIMSNGGFDRVQEKILGSLEQRLSSNASVHS